MPKTSLVEACDLISDNSAAFFLVAISNDGEACVRVNEPGLALSLAAANVRLRQPLLPHDILRLQELLGDLNKATSIQPKPRAKKSTTKSATSNVTTHMTQSTPSA